MIAIPTTRSYCKECGPFCSSRCNGEDGGYRAMRGICYHIDAPAILFCHLFGSTQVPLQNCQHRSFRERQDGPRGLVEKPAHCSAELSFARWHIAHWKRRNPLALTLRPSTLECYRPIPASECCTGRSRPQSVTRADRGLRVLLGPIAASECYSGRSRPQSVTQVTASRRVLQSFRPPFAFCIESLH